MRARHGAMGFFCVFISVFFSVFLSGALLLAPPPAAGGEPSLDLVELHRLIKPAPGESRWTEVPWMPATDIWAARRKAAEEGKPLFLWYMAGEPLGVC